MYAANLHQVFRENPYNQKYSCWVLLITMSADTDREHTIRDKHEDIDSALAEQNVNYSEITTRLGKRGVYEKFDVKTCSYPLYLVLNKHPLDYKKDDPYLVVEWGKWHSVDALKNDVMKFVNFFMDPEVRGQIAHAVNKTAWQGVLDFLKAHGLDLVSIGAKVLLAIF